MKLGIDVRPLAYGITGNSRYLAETLRILLKKRDKDHFVFFSNKPIHPVFADLLEFKNITVAIEKHNLPGPLYLNFLLPFRIKQQGVERFWGTLQMLPFMKLDIPTFVNYHDLNFVSAKETMAKWNYYQHKFFSPITLKNADTIFCLSQNTKNEISHFFPKSANKCIVVYPGVSKRKFKIQKGLFPKLFFLTVGTLEPRKNINTLISAFQHFKKNSLHNRYSLVILGRKGWGTEGEGLYQFLKSDESKQQSIIFMENPSDDVLGQALSECDAFYFPSLHEGFGLPLLEAMIENKKCIASDIPVFKEILDDKNDLYVKPFDVNAWEKTFHTLIKSKSNMRKPKFPAKEWSWEKTSHLLEEELFK